MSEKSSQLETCSNMSQNLCPDLRKAHEQQKALLEEDFEKLRLSLQVRANNGGYQGSNIFDSFLYSCVCASFRQDQVDTLTFQNQSLKDKAKRFEEALRRSTDEQIVVSSSPSTDNGG